MACEAIFKTTRNTHHVKWTAETDATALASPYMPVMPVQCGLVLLYPEVVAAAEFTQTHEM